jgi:hypothetical protein
MLILCGLNTRNLIGGYGVQQYFSYIVTVSFIGGGNRSTRGNPPHVTDKLDQWYKSFPGQKSINEACKKYA